MITIKCDSKEDMQRLLTAFENAKQQVFVEDIYQLITYKEALDKIKQLCHDQKYCDECPINIFCFDTWPLQFPKNWETDLIKEGK